MAQSKFHTLKGWEASRDRLFLSAVCGAAGYVAEHLAYITKGKAGKAQLTGPESSPVQRLFPCRRRRSGSHVQGGIPLHTPSRATA